MAEHNDSQGALHLPQLYSGMPVEVVTDDNQVMFSGRLALMGPGKIQIIERNGDSVRPVEYNSKIKLRGVLKDGEPFTFTGHVCGASDQFWLLDRLEVVQAAENRRNAFRQATVIDGMVFRMDANGEADAGSGPVPCQVMDISAGGTLLRCKQEFQAGDCLFLMGLELLPDQNDFSFTCRVRRVIPKGKDGFDYGCQFEGLTGKEEDRLLQAIFQIQRRALQSRRR